MCSLTPWSLKRCSLDAMHGCVLVCKCVNSRPHHYTPTHTYRWRWLCPLPDHHSPESGLTCGLASIHRVFHTRSLNQRHATYTSRSPMLTEYQRKATILSKRVYLSNRQFFIRISLTLGDWFCAPPPMPEWIRICVWLCEYMAANPHTTSTSQHRVESHPSLHIWFDFTQSIAS